MLTQVELALHAEKDAQFRWEWGYCLYAALLRQAPAGLGNAVHRDAITPLSQYVSLRGREPIWTVNLLGEESEQNFLPVLEQLQTVELEREHVRLQLAVRQKRSLESVDQLLAQASRHSGTHRMQVLTPAAFKSKGAYQNLPTTRLVIQSLLNKWNSCITECPIEDEDGQGMEALAAGLHCTEFHLDSRDYRMKGHPVPGFAGSLTLQNQLEGFHRQLADALLLFANYAGIGIKTTLGMGGVRIN